MRISVKELLDYTKCPLLFKFRHVDCLPYKKDIDDFYREIIKTSIFYYYFSMIERKIKSFESILRKWESLWFSSEMTQVFPESELRELSNKAVLTLTKFHKSISEESITPIAVNFPYDVILVGDKNIQVTGEIDLIKIIDDRTRKSETSLVFFSTARSKPDEFMLKNSISFTMASYAFRNSFKSKEDKIYINNINSQDNIYTARTGGDFSRAEKIIRNICKAIDEKIYYPNPNAFNCSGCRYKLFCINERSI